MSPVSDVEVTDRGGALSLDDCRCPVCLEVYMEPVTLPCTHTFCKDCFLQSVDKSTLCCPLCRKRVSTWARTHSRTNTLVDQQLWTRIQTAFPLQCQRRLNGQDHVPEDDPAVSVFVPRVSRPGELRQEYEDQVSKLTEEKRVLEEEERRASEEYIQRLLQEEEEQLQEDRRRREEDERLARLLSDQLNPAGVPPAQKKKKEVIGGQIERFLCPRPSLSSFTANKENFLSAQQLLPPQLDYYGDPDLHPSASGEDQRHLTTPSSKRKTSSLQREEEEETVPKRVCQSPPSSSSSSSSSSSCSSLEGGGSVLQGVTQWEKELLSRQQQQEEEDRRLALLLQKELDQEERQRATDRRKGSSDAYPLRQSRCRTEEVQEEVSRADTPSRVSRKTTKTSSTHSSAAASSSSSSLRGVKQATLTELFSSLNS